MPPRRTHTKSRNGCDQCKKRRVKCNEQGPPCSNCISRELHCTYLKAPASRGLADGSSTTVTSPSVPSPKEPEPTGQPQSAGVPGTRSLDTRSLETRSFGLRDLELMHKFSTETYQSLCTIPSDYYTWKVILPQQALSHDFLLNGILALAALHIASTLEPPAALSYIDTALEYHNMAFAPYRHAIDNLTPMNCDAVFGHSVITTVIGISLPRLTASRDESSNMTENIVVVFELLQGVSKILNISRPWMKTRLFSSGSPFFDVDCTKLDQKADAAISRLMRLNDESVTDANADQHRINKDAISILHKCFCRYTNNGDPGSVLAWLAAVDKEFVHRLRSRRPFPLLILMHWAVLLDHLDGQVWWARNSGKALVSELLPVVPPGDLSWEEARLWPKQKLGL